jgi:MarR family 2-MHQ and catechol resistance regulon transcriptional repressor
MDVSMGTRYQGSAEEKLALDTFIKFVRAGEAVKSRIDKQDTIASLSPSQFGTLEMIYHLGPLNQKDIGQKLLISKSNVVTIIDKLELRGLVKRQRSLEDRRCVFIHLTDEGREEIEQILPVHVSAITQEMNRISTEEQKELGRICRKLGLGK